jgi:magnesium Mg(2+) and cobalt Co(2+) transport protein (corA)
MVDEEYSNPVPDGEDIGKPAEKPSQDENAPRSAHGAADGKTSEGSGKGDASSGKAKSASSKSEGATSAAKSGVGHKTAAHLDETAHGFVPLQPDPNYPVFDTHVSVFAYGNDDFIEGPLTDVEKLPEIVSKWPVTWVHVVGFKNVDLLERLGAMLTLHHLALEDVVNLDQRPKIEDYGRKLFVVVRMIEDVDDRVESEQLSMFLLENCVITFDSDPGDCLEPVRERIRKGRGHIRDHGPDHLLYAIIDTVIDAYFPLLETFGERLEALESSILADPRRELIVELHGLKRDLLTMRRSIWPLRDVVNSMIRDTYPSISEETRIYLRDCYDHSVRIIDLIENYRQVASDLMDVYLSSVSNRMNEVMKVLTVISTIFIPPTFIAGIYGMNFMTEISPYNMPELTWYYGYPMCLGLMFFMTVGVLFYLYRRGMIGGGRAL